MELIEYKEMREAIQRVRELHMPFDKSTIGTSTGWCPQCGDYGQILYPCDTIQALDGDK